MFACQNVRAVSAVGGSLRARRRRRRRIFLLNDVKLYIIITRKPGESTLQLCHVRRTSSDWDFFGFFFCCCCSFNVNYTCAVRLLVRVAAADAKNVSGKCIKIKK